ncbi:MAG: methionine--tRNA ligase [Bernardetiaceae bacterium]|nr:methionine--tRNA ligase [Bernardetiaceae bacterium]
MPKEKYKRTLVTAALPYANGPLHIGHLAGAYLPADIYVRYLRLKGEDVVFVCGSDEHGAAITLRAKKEGISPREIIDKYHSINQKSFEDFGISFDIYHRTSDPVHIETSQAVFKKLHENDKFIEKTTEQFYDTEHNMFLADRYVMGTCPKCGYDSAYGDQCENCGTSLNPTELINPKSVLSNKTPELRETTHWFLPMNDYQEWLEEWIIKEKKGVWKTNVYGQCKGWLTQKLQPRAMTRDLDWGVPVPLEGAEGKVLYVWLDAPIGYISATKAWAETHNKDWEKYWKSEDTRLLHFIGKDNIVFHAIIFPIILKAHGDFILPENVPANNFLNLEGKKISTSRDWAVWVGEYMNDFPEQGDALRYVLTAIAPETSDSEFTWKDFQQRNNSELVATLGNFVHRTLVLTHKYFEGKVQPKGTMAVYDKQVLEAVGIQKQKIEQAIENFHFRDAQYELLELARIGNKYLADTEPWKLIKEDKELVGTILNVASQLSANLAILMRPFLPKAAEKLAYMLNFDYLSTVFDWEKVGKEDLLTPFVPFREAELLFEKIEDKTVAAQLEKLEQKALANQKPKEAKSEIKFEDFQSMDIRVATITAAEKVKKANKLLQLTLQTGLDTRTVVSGIAAYYKPEDIIGKQVCVLVNLAPRKIRGIESQGMILMAEDKDGKLAFVSPSQAVSDGSTIA